MFATCYGHLTFFVLAQQHAGELRAARLDDGMVTAAPVQPAGRDLGAIASDRAALVSDLAARCAPGCAARRATLRARIDALDAEAIETRRSEAQADRLTIETDRAESRRDGAQLDPVTSRVAAVLGWSQSRVDLATGLAFAAVLEGVACFCWLLAAEPGNHVRDRNRETKPMDEVFETTPWKAPVIASGPYGAPVGASAPVGVTDGSESVTGQVAEIVTDDRGQVAAEIAAGRLRCTVAEIRRFLGCSQTRALELRRELANEGRMA
ncbi:hypothetical protein [Pararobbsia silviterrae]